MTSPSYQTVAYQGAMLGGAPVPVSGEREDPAFLWERAYRDALKALRSIPDAGTFAVSIDERHRDGLRSAWRSECGWRVQPEYVRDFRTLGLVEVGGDAGNEESRNHLTAFGFAVRRVVMEAI